jgi:hypothetical protein
MCAPIRLSRFRLESPSVRLAFGVRRLAFGQIGIALVGSIAL